MIAPILKYVIFLVTFQPCKEDFPYKFTFLSKLSMSIYCFRPVSCYSNMYPCACGSWFVGISCKCSLEQTAIFCNNLLSAKKPKQQQKRPTKFNTLVFNLDEYKPMINSAVFSEKDIFFWSSS